MNQVNGYHIERIATADCRGFTLPVLPAEGKVAQNGAPIGNNVTCNLEIRQAIAYCIDRLTRTGYMGAYAFESEYRTTEEIAQDVAYIKSLI